MKTNLCAVLVALMLVVRNFNGENAAWEFGCPRKATERSTGFAVSTGRSALGVYVNFICFVGIGRTGLVNVPDTDV